MPYDAYICTRCIFTCYSRSKHQEFYKSLNFDKRDIFPKWMWCERFDKSCLERCQDLLPGIGTTSCPWWRTQERASWAGVHPYFLDNTRSRVYRILFFSKFSPVYLGCLDCEGAETFKSHNITLITSCMEDDYGRVNFILPINFLMVHSLQLPCHQRSHEQVGCMELFQYQVPWMQVKLFMRTAKAWYLRSTNPKLRRSYNLTRKCNI